MPDYDLSRLSSRSFEQLIQALSAKVLGYRLLIFGDGPDGGREATFEGTVSYPSTQDAWNGYGVVQAKFRQRSGNATDDGKWAVAQLRSEIDRYLQPDSSLRLPDYFVFATNVVLTPASVRGSKDRCIELLEDLKNRLPLKGYAIWDYDQIRVFLDSNKDIRHAYTPWITPGDVLARVVDQFESPRTDFLYTLHNFLQKQLLSDEFVNLEQAGHDVSEGIPLARVFVDLHTVDVRRSGLSQGFSGEDRYLGYDEESDSKGFIKSMLSVASERLDPESLDAATLGRSPNDGVGRHSRGRFVLIGGPGQGKTTVAQFICQIFRASIIDKMPQHQLSSEVRAALAIIGRHCKEDDIEICVVPRFPFRIVLNEFAAALSSGDLSNVNSVLSFLAHMIQKRTDRSVSVDDLYELLGHYPSIIVFDGLDEVPSSSNRTQVLDAIRDFWIDANNANADIVSIATSRPQGYNEDFAPDLYQHLRLVPLSEKLGKHFAQRLVDVRYGSDTDRKEKVLSRLHRSFESESTSRLMRSPLQVTIMTALVDRLGQPPQARWKLFDAYYDVIYQREVEREIPASGILREYEPDINAIHSRVGLLLQIDSEQTGRTDTMFSQERFNTLVSKRLEEEGHEGEDLVDLRDQIVGAALERLVFLVGLESGQVGFEIRSLQEFMAAESLMEAPDDDVRRRLEEIGPLANWRNVFLFAAGKCFAERQHLRDAVYRICGALNENAHDPICARYFAGSGLALDLLDDGLCRRQPKFVEVLARIAIRSLDSANARFHLQLISVYRDRLEALYKEEISGRLVAGKGRVRSAAWGCLLGLVERRVNWADVMAREYWPDEVEEQIRIMSASRGFLSVPWVAKKFFDLIPVISAHRLRDVARSGLVGGSHESDYLFGKADNGLEGNDLPAYSHAAIKVLFGEDYSVRRPIELLGFRHVGLGLIQLFDEQEKWFLKLGEIPPLRDCHVTWTVYRSAARFLRSPCKEVLARELRFIAKNAEGSDLDVESYWYWQIPWPLAACLSMCRERSELTELASRASRGDFGDSEDWIAAENRWLKSGVDEADIATMADSRLPFDDTVAVSGFPTNLSVWRVLFHDTDSLKFLRAVLDTHSRVADSDHHTSRAFLASVATMCLIGTSLIRSADHGESKSRISLASLRSILVDLPVSSMVPLEVVVNQVDESSEEKDIRDIFRVIGERNLNLMMYHLPGGISRIGIEILWREYSSIRDADYGDSLLGCLGLLAEHGHLGKEILRVAQFSDNESPDRNVGEFLLMLANEAWESGRTNMLIHQVKGIASSDVSVGIFERTINTISALRFSGVEFEQFVIDFGALLPVDDYGLYARYLRVLEGLLERRTSRFTNPKQCEELGMPSGIVELL